MLENDLNVRLYKITKRKLISDDTKKKRSKIFLFKFLDGTQPQVFELMRNYSLFKLNTTGKMIIFESNKDLVIVERQTSFRRQKQLQ